MQQGGVASHLGHPQTNTQTAAVTPHNHVVAGEGAVLLTVQGKGEKKNTSAVKGLVMNDVWDKEGCGTTERRINQHAERDLTCYADR